MDGPGISIFQGSETLELGTNGQEDEEDEALEEEKRRNDELKDLLTNAFDDLTDDDQSYANSSLPASSHDTTDRGESFEEDQNLEEIAHNPSHNYQVPLNKNVVERRDYHAEPMELDKNSDPRLFMPHKNRINGGGDANVSALHYKHCAKNSPGYTDVQSLELYRMQEDDENLTADNDNYLKADYNSMEQLQVMYDVRVREIERLHNEIEITKKHNKEMETQLKRRLALMEAEKERAVLSLKQSQNLLVTSKAQISDLEKQIEQQTSKIKDLEESNFELKTELDITKISVASLQSKISLLEKLDYPRQKEQENESYVRVIEERHRREIAALQEEIQAAKIKLEKKENMQILQGDMNNYDFDLLNSESVKDNDSLHQLGLTGKDQLPAGSIHPIADLNAKLKDELKRSLVGQRMKREEIKRLQMELESKNQQIKEMQLQESKYLAEAENFKVQTQQLLQHLQKEALGNTGDTKSKQSALEKEVSSLKKEIELYKDEKKVLITVKERLEKENSELNSQNIKLSNQIEEISKIKEKEKMDAINQFQDEYINFHDKAIARLRAEKNEELEKELNELRKQLEEAQKEAVEAKTTYLELMKDKSRKSDGSGMVNMLKLELAQEKEAFAKFKESHESLVQRKCNQFKSENEKHMREVEERSRLLYEKKVYEEIEKAKRETLKELENHYKTQIENKRKELQEEMAKKLDLEMSKIRKETMKEPAHTKEPDEKTTELYRECCRLREELKNKQDDWQKEIEKIKHEAERDKLEKLREQQKEIEERLGNEFREQLKKAESTRDQAAKMLKEQLEAEQKAFLEQYEEKLHEFSLKVKSQSTRSIGTSTTNLDEMTVVRLDQVDGVRSDEMVSKMVAEAVHKVRVEEEAKYAGNLEVFRSLMEKKAKEVDGMKNAMATERNRLMSALVEVKNAASEAELKTRRSYEDILKNKDSEIKKLKEQVILLAKEIEMIDLRASKEKDMMAEVMARWASEVKELKKAREDEEKQLLHVYKKYKEIKKTVALYKVSKEEQFQNEHKKLVEHFNQALATIEEKMKDACTKHDASQAERIAAIEASFEKKAEKLRNQKDKLRANNDVL